MGWDAKPGPRGKITSYLMLGSVPPLTAVSFPFDMKYVDGVAVHRMNCPDTGDRPAIQPL
jgi:hypothetical protein